ncbi:MAG: hypothetical protein IKG59_08265 [Firmicutes bacterium]|nr:hypothetical protein [Bacillota bacterium]
MIDDGLFVYHESLAAGKSAKREKTKTGAIKTALFTRDDHAREVADAIGRLAPESILVLGTSDKMADRITDRLGLPRASEYIHIEDITTEEERELALKQRKQQGKHVIPVPTLQLKRDFAGYFLDPLKLIKQVRSATDRGVESIQETLRIGGKEPDSAKTVVRPTYSYMGDFIISDSVVTDIANCVADEVDGISEVVSVFENTEPDNLMLQVVVDMDRGAAIWSVAEEYQKKLSKVVEDMTAFNVVETDVEVRQLVNRR